MYMKNLYQYESSGLNMKIARRSHFVKEFSKYLKMRDKNKENQNKLFEIVLILFLFIIYRNQKHFGLDGKNSLIHRNAINLYLVYSIRNMILNY